MSKRNDSYHEIENRQAGKRLLKKELLWTRWFVYAALAFMILYGFTAEKVDFSADMFFSTPFDKDGGFSSTKFNYAMFIFPAAFLTFFLYGIFFLKTYEEKVREKQVKMQRRRRNLSSVDKIELTIWKYLDMAFSAIGHVLGAMFFSGVDEDSDKEKVFIRLGWLNHLERNFFKQVVKRADGYERVEKLSLLKDYHEYFSKEKGEEGKTSLGFSFLISLFKSRKDLYDLMLIAEGFISIGKKKYDKVLNKAEFEERLRAAGSLNNIRMFNGRDEVLFSHDVIKALLDDEAARFEDYIRKYAFKSRMLFTRRFSKYAGELRRDVNARKYLFPRNQDKFAEKVMGNDEMYSEYLIFAMITYFRFVTWKSIIGQYVNLPAGTIVVKQRDYTIRMITESFDDKSLINISLGKNDGSSENFESDNLVNLFLAAFNHYSVSVENSSIARIQRIFNFDDTISAAMEEKNESSISDIKSTYAADWGDGPATEGAKSWLDGLANSIEGQ